MRLPHPTRTSRPRTWAVSAAAVLALSGALASCGGNGGYSTTPKAQGAAPVTVQTRSGALGTYLTDGHGQTLYLLTSDTGKMSTCTGGCAKLWPPLMAHGTTKAGSDALAADLGTSARPDGGSQVTYAGHPLYYYGGDATPGDVTGQGINSYGGHWWVLDAQGKAVKKAADTSTDGSGRGGYGY